MKFKKTWCGFFTATGIAAIGGAIFTARAANKVCNGLLESTQEMVNSFLNNNVGFSGSMKMDLLLGDSTDAIPIASKNLLVSMHMDLNEKLIEQLMAFPKTAEAACQAAILNEGITDTLLLLFASASVVGIAFLYKHTQKPEQEQNQERYQSLGAGLPI
ncbi:MAG: hypothetical protein P4M12_04040 [Gammaproteobacteria bacterium]|nr:hypothetical protein [Gammaproteobacteria bacterium]